MKLKIYNTIEIYNFNETGMKIFITTGQLSKPMKLFIQTNLNTLYIYET